MTKENDSLAMKQELKTSLQETLQEIIEHTKKTSPNVAVAAINSTIKLYELDKYKEQSRLIPKFVYITKKENVEDEN